MAISPVSGAIRAMDAMTRPEDAVRGGSGRDTQQAPIEEPRDMRTPSAGRSADVEELKQLAARQSLELRIEALPDSGTVRFRLVDPTTGDVVREFPPEGLSQAMAEFRARAAAHLNVKR